VESRQVHLTLHFFGSIPEREVELVDLSMKKIARCFGLLGLRLSAIGGFPGLEKPSIVWLGVEEKTGALLSLRKVLRDEIRRLGFETESRLFCPHVTVGRVKNKAGDLRPVLTGIPLELPTPEKTAEHFVLYQSHCLAQGARYEILKNYPLSKKT
jgi:2'-5' RNA ligase